MINLAVKQTLFQYFPLVEEINSQPSKIKLKVKLNKTACRISGNESEKLMVLILIKEVISKVFNLGG